MSARTRIFTTPHFGDMMGYARLKGLPRFYEITLDDMIIYHTAGTPVANLVRRAIADLQPVFVRTIEVVPA